MAKKDSSGHAGEGLTPEVAFRRASFLCSKQEQSTGHIREKLRQWEVDPGIAESVIERLTKEDFLNDKRFAGFYVRDKFRLNKWGRIKIGHMLRQNGIGEEIISAALEQLPEEEYFRTCYDLLRQKSLTLKEKNLFTRKGKLYRFAASRGFEPDLIYRVLNMPLD